MLTEKEIMEIAENYAESHRTPYCFYQLEYVVESQFVNGYYDVCYRVMDSFGREIDGALIIAVDVQNGDVISLEELIKIKMRMEEQ